MIPVPVESEQVVQAIVDSVLLRRPDRAQQLHMPLDLDDPRVNSLHAEWDRAAEREGKTRARFAQDGINPEEVQRELKELEPALGSTDDVHDFVANAIQRFNGELRKTKDDGVFELYPGDIRDQILLRGGRSSFPMRVAFDGVPPDGVSLIGRNHPVVTALSNAVLANALTGSDTQFARSGAIYTDSVTTRTAVLVMRLRYLLEETTQHFAEEVVVIGFTRSGQGIEWLTPLQEEALRLLKQANITANMPAEDRKRQVDWALGMLEGDWYEEIVDQRVKALEASHKRLRAVVKANPLKVTLPTLRRTFSAATSSYRLEGHANGLHIHKRRGRISTVRSSRQDSHR